MIVGLAGVLPAAVRDQEDDIDAQPYLWSDLLARRNALALRREDLAPVLRVDEQKYRARETGSLPVGPYLAEELIAMEEFVADTAAALVAAAGGRCGRAAGRHRPGRVHRRLPRRAHAA